MKQKNDVEVMINQKRVIVSGYESAAYLQKVASYLNDKYLELKKMEYYTRLEREMQEILLQINIADDYFKATEQIEHLEQEKIERDRDLFHLKHRWMDLENELAMTQKTLKQLQEEYQEAQKRIVKLETELEDQKKQGK